MSEKRTVIMQGDPLYNEEGVANETIRPGYLVKGVSVIAKQTSTVLPVQKMFAVERAELGQGIDNTRQGSGTSTAYYASGDTVKVAVCGAGDIVTAYIASGEDVNEDDILASNGDGTLSKLSAYSSGTGPDFPIARSLEDTGGAGHDVQLIKVQVL